jgi:TPR repeat protein
MSTGAGHAPNAREQQEFELRSLEIEIKRRELKLKEKERPGSTLKNPLVVGVFVAALGLFGNIVVTYLQNRAQQSLAQQKAQSDLILEAIKTGDVQKASSNLQFFIDAHLVNDEQGFITQAIKAGHSPSLPASTAQQISARDEANRGWWYETGQIGGKPDYEAAMRWYLKAVDDGDVKANWNIGRLYEFGFGVTPNLATAKSWYQKAADKGDMEAQDSLAHLGNNRKY